MQTQGAAGTSSPRRLVAYWESHEEAEDEEAAGEGEACEAREGEGLLGGAGV